MAEVFNLFGGQPPQAVLFDLDGTLVDSLPDIAWALDRMLEQHGRAPAGAARVSDWVGNGSAVLVRRALANSADPAAVAAVDDALAARCLDDFFAHYRSHLAVATRCYPGVEATLAACAGWGAALAVVTNKPEAFAREILRQLGIAEAFAGVLGGDSLAEKKPHPLPLQQAMADLGSTPATTLMVGDSRTDVDAARAAGCPVVCVTFGYNHGEPVSACGPDRLYDRFGQLVE